MPRMVCIRSARCHLRGVRATRGAEPQAQMPTMATGCTSKEASRLVINASNGPHRRPHRRREAGHLSHEINRCSRRRRPRFSSRVRTEHMEDHHAHKVNLSNTTPWPTTRSRCRGPSQVVPLSKTRPSAAFITAHRAIRDKLRRHKSRHCRGNRHGRRRKGDVDPARGRAGTRTLTVKTKRPGASARAPGRDDKRRAERTHAYCASTSSEQPPRTRTERSGAKAKPRRRGTRAMRCNRLWSGSSRLPAV